MNRRGFLGRLGAVCGAAVATVTGKSRVPPPLEASNLSEAPATETIQFRPVPHPAGTPTFREAFEAARRGEIWAEGRAAPVEVPRRQTAAEIRAAHEQWIRDNRDVLVDPPNAKPS